jgi:hypothetical protein
MPSGAKARNRRAALETALVRQLRRAAHEVSRYRERVGVRILTIAQAPVGVVAEIERRDQRPAREVDDGRLRRRAACNRRRSVGDRNAREERRPQGGQPARVWRKRGREVPAALDARDRLDERRASRQECPAEHPRHAEERQGRAREGDLLDDGEVDPRDGERGDRDERCEPDGQARCRDPCSGEGEEGDEQHTARVHDRQVEQHRARACKEHDRGPHRPSHFLRWAPMWAARLRRLEKIR